MPITFTYLQLIGAIRKEFDLLLSGSGVSWSKQGMQIVLERAFLQALQRLMEK